ncbi:phosphoribosylglycinamide formyltransferase [Pandoraea nosoerga]|nr:MULTISPECIES: phosphoribosylglycinamide formyltransferase [Pandoraea]MBN4666344.1 phosphoribosylglycinamide formyltransferase [Pandoraea nosoerga]MBN4675977.1 phosphoribosylglycinamide formyltransferase [Pandoraea nosoerga]MBN4682072.1 phosphoribosylglycinamide formyltransferase [Pandoraea nosoerga]MBN4746461.1 phosphoribosylglycinamide formyltransferase [Pandoraea nosoerga]
MKNIVILISGRGSNMQAIVRACTAEGWPARVAAVIANRAEAEGLAFAQQHGIATAVVPSRGKTREAFDAELAAEIDRHRPDLVVLAGFMRILTPEFTERYAGRLVNIHPSLLPAFTGLQTHARALEAGCKIVGATVHFVTADLDHGPFVLQAAVPVRAGDTPQTLAARILPLEHIIYPRAVRWFVEDRLIVADGRVTVKPAADGTPEPQWLFGEDA